MNISFPNNLMDSEKLQYKYNLQKVSETQSGSKTVAKNRITAETGGDKAENDRLLRKVQFAQTKAEVLAEYLGAMQNAVRESGSNGILMYRRVGNLMATERAYEETDYYKNKKDADTFLLDQIEVLEKRQEEMQELKEAQAEAQENTSPSDENNSQSVARDVSGNGTVKTQQSRKTSVTQNTDFQQRAARSYKTKDAPERNPSTQELFNSII